METGATTAYGASLAGGGFDFMKFIRQPQTIVRLLSWLFALVVFATITGEGYGNPTSQAQVKCVFNENNAACHYGVGIGIIGFLACVAFLVLDAYLPHMSNAKERKYVVTADLIFSGAWTFLWFVCFCFLANMWSKTAEVEHIPTDAAHAVIAFSFFSVASWGALTYFALMRYRQGVDDIAKSIAEPSTDHAPEYPSSYAPSYPPYPTSGPDAYQQPPYTSTTDSQGDYQPPAY